MKTTFPTESDTSPAPGIIPEPPVVHDEPIGPGRGRGRLAASTSIPPAARRAPFARLLSALRGDKYMVDAYPSDVPANREH